MKHFWKNVWKFFKTPISDHLTNLFDTLKDFFSSPTQSRFFALIGLIILAVALPVTIVVLQQRTNIFQHASNTCASIGGTCTTSQICKGNFTYCLNLSNYPCPGYPSSDVCATNTPPPGTSPIPVGGGGNGGDPCAGAHCGNGWYCAGACGVTGNANTRYDCQGNVTRHTDYCQYGCQVNSGSPDSCRTTPVAIYSCTTKSGDTSSPHNGIDVTVNGTTKSSGYYCASDEYCSGQGPNISDVCHKINPNSCTCTGTTSFTCDGGTPASISRSCGSGMVCTSQKGAQGGLWPCVSQTIPDYSNCGDFHSGPSSTTICQTTLAPKLAPLCNYDQYYEYNLLTQFCHFNPPGSGGGSYSCTTGELNDQNCPNSNYYCDTSGDQNAACVGDATQGGGVCSGICRLKSSTTPTPPPSGYTCVSPKDPKNNQLADVSGKPLAKTYCMLGYQCYVDPTKSTTKNWNGKLYSTNSTDLCFNQTSNKGDPCTKVPNTSSANGYYCYNATANSFDSTITKTNYLYNCEGSQLKQAWDCGNPGDSSGHGGCTIHTGTSDTCSDGYPANGGGSGGGGNGGGGGNPTPTPTSIPCTNGKDTKFALNVKLDGIGITTYENSNPLHPSRTGQVRIYGGPSVDVLPNGMSQTFTFDKSSGNFDSTTIDAGTSLTCGKTYKVEVKLPGYLPVTADLAYANTSQIIKVEPIGGDINQVDNNGVIIGDGKVDINDYSVYRQCRNVDPNTTIPFQSNTTTVNVKCGNLVNFFDFQDGGTMESVPFPASGIGEWDANYNLWLKWYIEANGTSIPSGSGSTWRVNAGGTAYTDSSGNLWSADGEFSGGGTYTALNTISGTNDQALYQSERYGSSFTYTFPVQKGSTYQVLLKFAEIFWSASGKRVFNVSINGQTELTDFDIFAQAGQGNKAIDKVIPNISPDTNGNIVITFGPASVDNAKVDAIQITPQANLQ